MQTSTLRPGLLVSLKTSLKGGVTYIKEGVESRITQTGAEKTKWETERTIKNPTEHANAIKVRGKIRGMILGECSPSSFGYLCLESNAANLEKAIKEGRRLAREFNEESTIHKIKVGVLTGRVSPNDVEAVRAIKLEITDLIETMTEGVKELNVDKVREAAGKAKAISNMLTDDAQSKVKEAVAAARKAAREIVKAGEEAAIVIDRSVLKTLAEARTAFLDIEEVAETEVLPETGRALDLDPTALLGPDGENIPSGDGPLPSTAELQTSDPEEIAAQERFDNLLEGEIPFPPERDVQAADVSVPVLELV